MFKKFNKLLNKTFKGLKFEISESKAKTLFGEKSFFEKSSDDNSEIVKYEGNTIRKEFIPFYSGEAINLQTEYTGRCAIDNIVPCGKTYIVTTYWSKITGVMKPIDYPLGTEELQLYAGIKYPEQLVNKVLVTDKVSNIKDHISDNTVPFEEFYIKENFAKNTIYDKLLELEKKRIKKYIKNKGHADRVEIKIKLIFNKPFKLYTYFIPTYVFEYNNKSNNISSVLESFGLKYNIMKDETKYVKILNGHTGNISGEKVLSVWKTAIAGSSVTALTSLFWLLSFHPYLKGPAILLRVVSSALTGGLITGLISGNKHKLKRWKYDEDLEEKKKINEQYQETNEDRMRREYIKKLNNMDASQAYNIGGNSDKYTILGLKYKEKITLSEVKTAYHKKIFDWHPDKYQKNIDLANEKSKEINKAYNEFLKEFTKNI